MYFLAAELALELGKTINKEFLSGLRTEGSNVQVKTCKKN